MFVCVNGLRMGLLLPLVTYRECTVPRVQWGFVVSSFLFGASEQGEKDTAPKCVRGQAECCDLQHVLSAEFVLQEGKNEKTRVSNN